MRQGHYLRLLIAKSSPLNFTDTLLNVALLSVGYRHVCPFTEQSQVSCHSLSPVNYNMVFSGFDKAISLLLLKILLQGQYSDYAIFLVSSLMPLSLFHQIYLSRLCFKGLSGPCNHYSLGAYSTGFDCFSMKFSNLYPFSHVLEKRPIQ